MFPSDHLTVSGLLHSFLNLVHLILNLDPLVFVNFGLLVVGVITSVRSTGNILYNFAERICLSTVHVEADDVLYEDIVRWMNDHEFKRRNFLSVLAETNIYSDSEKDPTQPSQSELDSDTLINYQGVDDQSVIDLTPFNGSRLFRFKRKWILFNHSTNSHNLTSHGFQGGSKRELTLQCLSLSLAPSKDFLDEVRAYSRKVSVSTIKVYRTRQNSREAIRWSSVASRPSRDISTVIMDKHKKKTILRDINEYLHPYTRHWYANHGIPYRRGYLFSGPPGTGKTSLASAIAGVFGLDIYVLSLLDPNMTEPLFIQLLSEVTARCVVLLEDVDATGLSGRDDLVPSQNCPSSISAQSNQGTTKTTPISTSAMSLSGLLNAIDGVSSNEGHILIMTTNVPQHLDRALIRPGRVDMHIRFELPSREELRNLFLSIYSDMSQNTAVSEQEKHTEKLEELAGRFAGRLPEGRFSVAEVQGFLLLYKRQPNEACENVSCWVKEMEDR